MAERTAAWARPGDTVGLACRSSVKRPCPETTAAGGRIRRAAGSPTICISISSILALTAMSERAPVLGRESGSSRDADPNSRALSWLNPSRRIFAQHVEFALAYEIVAPLTLDHGLDFALGVFAFAVFF